MKRRFLAGLMAFAVAFSSVPQNALTALGEEIAETGIAEEAVQTDDAAESAGAEGSEEGAEEAQEAEQFRSAEDSYAEAVPEEDIPGEAEAAEASTEPDMSAEDFEAFDASEDEAAFSEDDFFAEDEETPEADEDGDLLIVDEEADLLPEEELEYAWEETWDLGDEAASTDQTAATGQTDATGGESLEDVFTSEDEAGSGSSEEEPTEDVFEDEEDPYDTGSLSGYYDVLSADDMEHAVPLIFNESQKVELNSSQQYKIYKFIAPDDGTFTFRALRSPDYEERLEPDPDFYDDSFGWLYDSNGQFLQEDDDEAGNYNFMLRYQLTEGEICYIKAGMLSTLDGDRYGEYTLEASIYFAPVEITNVEGLQGAYPAWMYPNFSDVSISVLYENNATETIRYGASDSYGNRFYIRSGSEDEDGVWSGGPGTYEIELQIEDLTEYGTVTKISLDDYCIQHQNQVVQFGQKVLTDTAVSNSYNNRIQYFFKAEEAGNYLFSFENICSEQEVYRISDTGRIYQGFAEYSSEWNEETQSEDIIPGNSKIAFTLDEGEYAAVEVGYVRKVSDGGFIVTKGTTPTDINLILPEDGKITVENYRDVLSAKVSYEAAEDETVKPGARDPYGNLVDLTFDNFDYGYLDSDDYADTLGDQPYTLTCGNITKTGSIHFISRLEAEAYDHTVEMNAEGEHSFQYAGLHVNLRIVPSVTGIYEIYNPDDMIGFQLFDETETRVYTTEEYLDEDSFYGYSLEAGKAYLLRLTWWEPSSSPEGYNYSFSWKKYADPWDEARVLTEGDNAFTDLAAYGEGFSATMAVFTPETDGMYRFSVDSNLHAYVTDEQNYGVTSCSEDNPGLVQLEAGKKYRIRIGGDSWNSSETFSGTLNIFKTDLTISNVRVTLDRDTFTLPENRPAFSDIHIMYDYTADGVTGTADYNCSQNDPLGLPISYGSITDVNNEDVSFDLYGGVNAPGTYHASIYLMHQEYGFDFTVLPLNEEDILPMELNKVVYVPAKTKATYRIYFNGDEVLGLAGGYGAMEVVVVNESRFYQETSFSSSMQFGPGEGLYLVTADNTSDSEQYLIFRSTQQLVLGENALSLTVGGYPNNYYFEAPAGNGMGYRFEAEDSLEFSVYEAGTGKFLGNYYGTFVLDGSVDRYRISIYTWNGNTGDDYLTSVNISEVPIPESVSVTTDLTSFRKGDYPSSSDFDVTYTLSGEDTPRLLKNGEQDEYGYQAVFTGFFDQNGNEIYDYDQYIEGETYQWCVSFGGQLYYGDILCEEPVVLTEGENPLPVLKYGESGFHAVFTPQVSAFYQLEIDKRGVYCNIDDASYELVLSYNSTNSSVLPVVPMTAGNTYHFWVNCDGDSDIIEDAVLTITGKEELELQSVSLSLTENTFQLPQNKPQESQILVSYTAVNGEDTISNSYTLNEYWDMEKLGFQYDMHRIYDKDGNYVREYWAGAPAPGEYLLRVMFAGAYYDLPFTVEELPDDIEELSLNTKVTLTPDETKVFLLNLAHRTSTRISNDTNNILIAYADTYSQYASFGNNTHWSGDMEAGDYLLRVKNTSSEQDGTFAITSVDEVNVGDNIITVLPGYDKLLRFTQPEDQDTGYRFTWPADLFNLDFGVAYDSETGTEGYWLAYERDGNFSYYDSDTKVLEISAFLNNNSEEDTPTEPQTFTLRVEEIPAVKNADVELSRAEFKRNEWIDTEDFNVSYTAVSSDGTEQAVTFGGEVKDAYGYVLNNLIIRSAESGEQVYELAEVGTYTWEAIFAGETYTGSFECVQSDFEAEIENQTVTWAPDLLLQPVIVTDPDTGNILDEDTDYVVSYAGDPVEDSNNIGTVTVTVSGRGEYEGREAVTEYEVTACELTGDNVSMFSDDSFTYQYPYVDNFTPAFDALVSLADDSSEANAEWIVLTDADYNYTLYRMIETGNEPVDALTNVGDYVLHLEFTGHYSGSADYTITVEPRELSNDEIILESIDDYDPGQSDGELPVPVLSVNGYTLQEGTDFIIEGYENISTAGTGSVQISGMGNFTGTMYYDFTVLDREAPIVTDLSPSNEYALTGTGQSFTVWAEDNLGVTDVYIYAKSANGGGSQGGEPEPQTEPYVEPEPQTEPYVEPEPQTEPYVEPEPQTDPYDDPDAESDTGSESVSENGSDPDGIVIAPKFEDVNSSYASDGWDLYQAYATESGYYVCEMDTTVYPDGYLDIAVIAVDEAGNASDAFNRQYEVDNTPPAQVTGLAAEYADYDGILLSWDANTEEDLSYYRVERRGAYMEELGEYEWYGLTSIYGETTYLYQDTDELIPGETYYFRVSAIDRSGLEGAYSDELSVELILDEEAPEISQASVSGGAEGYFKDTAYLNAYLTDNYDLKDVTVYARPEEGEDIELFSGPVWEHDDTQKLASYSLYLELDTSTLAEGSYTVILKVSDRFDNEGWSDDTSESMQIRIDRTAPDIPANLKAYTGNGYIRVFWDRPEAEDLAYFDVYRSEDAETFEQVGYGLDEETFRDDYLIEEGKVYYYQVTASDKAGNVSGRSDTLEIRSFSPAGDAVHGYIKGEGGYLQFERETGLIDGYIDEPWSVAVPASWDGTQITGITADALDGCGTLEQLVLPVGFTSIAEGAFDDCTDLTLYAAEGSEAEGYAAANEAVSFTALTISRISPANLTSFGGETWNFTVETTSPVSLPLTFTAEPADGTDPFVMTSLATNFYYGTFNVEIDLKDVVSGEYTINIGSEDYGMTASRIYAIDRTAPAMLQDFTVTPDIVMNRLTWKKAAEADTDFSYYNIYRKKVADDAEYELVTTISNAEQTYYTDRDVEPEVDYAYMVSATDIYGQEGEKTTPLVGKPEPDTIVPEITKISPEAGTMLHGVYNFTLTAEDNCDVGEVVLEYTTAETFTDDTEWTVGARVTYGGSVTLPLDTTQIDAEKIYVRFKATDVYGNEAYDYYWTNHSEVNEPLRYPIDNQGPAKVEGLHYAATSVTITLNWEDVPDEDFGYFQVEQLQADESVRFVTTVSDALGCYIDVGRPEVKNTYRVVAYDIYGNRGEESDWLETETVADVTAPVVSKISPDPQYVNGNLYMTFNLSDDAGMDHVVIQTSQTTMGTKEWTDLETKTLTDHRPNIAFDYKLDTTAFEEGSLYVRAVPTDLAGNEGNSSDTAPFVEYIVDRTPPEVPEILGIEVNSAGGYATVEWKQGWENDLAGYSVYRSSTGNEGDFSLLASGLTTITYNDTAIKMGETYYYALSVKDQAGNESAMSEIVAAEIPADSVNPVIYSVSPADASVLGANTSITVVAGDNGTVRTISAAYKADGAEEWTDLPDIQVGKSSGTYYLNISPAKVCTETLAVKVMCTDTAGNESDIVTRNYSVDFTAPEAPVLSVAYDETKNTAQLTWTSANEEDLNGFYIYRKASADDSYTFIASEPKGEENTYTLSDDDLKSAKTYTYRVNAVDFLGNISRSNEESITTPENAEEQGEEYAQSQDVAGPNVVIYANILGETGAQMQFSAEGCSDESGIASYLWDFGDANDPTPSRILRPFHTYTAAGTYTVKLTVTDTLGNSSEEEMVITIQDPLKTGAVRVTVTDENGTPVQGAGVYFDLGQTGMAVVKTDSAGMALLYGTEGQHPIGAYLDGYLPDRKDVQILRNDTVDVHLIMEHKDIVAGELTVKRMTLKEIIEAGINVQDEANQNIFKFVIHLEYKQQPLTFEGYLNDEGEVIDRPDPIPIIKWKRIVIPDFIPWPWIPDDDDDDDPDPHPGGGEEVPAPETPTVAFIDIPGDVTWLKDFFDVELNILNQARPEFYLDDCVGYLNVPDGLTLMDTNRTKADPSVSMGTIQGQHRGYAEWIVRGDRPGSYDLTADFSATLRDFGASVNRTFQSSQPVEVSDGSDLWLDIYVENAILHDTDGAIKVAFRNEGAIPVNCPNINLEKVLFKRRYKMEGTQIVDDDQVLEQGQQICSEYIIRREDWEALMLNRENDMYLSNQMLEKLEGMDINYQFITVQPFTICPDRIDVNFVNNDGSTGSEAKLIDIKKKSGTANVPDLKITTYTTDEFGADVPTSMTLTIRDEYWKERFTDAGGKEDSWVQTIQTDENGECILEGYEITDWTNIEEKTGSQKLLDILNPDETDAAENKLSYKSYTISLSTSRGLKEIPVVARSKVADVGQLIVNVNGPSLKKKTLGQPVKIKDAKVTVADTVRKTNRSGVAKFNAIQQGEQLVTIEAPGYETLTEVVTVGKSTEKKFELYAADDSNLSHISSIKCSVNSYSVGNMIVIPEGVVKGNLGFTLETELKNGDKQKGFLYEIRNKDGVLIDEGEFNSKTFTLNLDQMAAGYTLKFAMKAETADGQMTQSSFKDSHLKIISTPGFFGTLAYEMGRYSDGYELVFDKSAFIPFTLGKKSNTTAYNFNGTGKADKLFDESKDKKPKEMSKFLNSMDYSVKSTHSVEMKASYDLSGKLKLSATYNYGRERTNSDKFIYGKVDYMNISFKDGLLKKAEKINVDGSVTFEVEFSYDTVEDNWYLTTYLSGEGSGKAKSPTLQGTILYANMDVTGKGSFKMILSKTNLGKNPDLADATRFFEVLETTLGADVGVHFGGKIGTENLLSLGAFGELGVEMQLLPAFVLSIHERLGWEGKILWKKIGDDWFNEEQTIAAVDYQDLGTNSAGTGKLAMRRMLTGTDLTDELYESGVLLASEEGSMEQNWEGGDEILASNVYYDVQPQTVTLPDGKVLMVYVDYAVESDASNPVRVFYSIYDGSSWSAPKAVAVEGTAGTAGLYPQLTAAGGVPVLTWMNMTTQLTDMETTTYEEIQSGIYTRMGVLQASYDAASDTWTKRASAGSGSIVMTPEGLADGDEELLVWVTNAQNNEYASEDNPDQIAYALSVAGETIDEGSLNLTEEGIFDIGKISLLKSGDDYELYAQAVGDEYQGMIYRSMYDAATHAWGSFSVIDTYSRSAEDSAVVNGNVYVLISDRIMRLEKDEETGTEKLKQMVCDESLNNVYDFDAEPYGENGVVFTWAQNVNEHAIYISISEDGKTFAAPQIVAVDDDMLQTPQITSTGSGWMFVYRKSMSGEDAMSYELKTAQLTLGTDLAVNNVTATGFLVGGAALSTSFDVSSHGMVKPASVKAVISTSEDGSDPLAETTLNGASGKIDWTVPVNYGGEPYYVVVLPADGTTDANMKNNAALAGPQMMDLSIDGGSYDGQNADGEATLIVHISNTGMVAAVRPVLKLTDMTTDEVVYNETLEPLTAGEEKDIRISYEGIVDAQGWIAMLVDEGQAEETDYDNNQRMIVKGEEVTYGEEEVHYCTETPYLAPTCLEDGHIQYWTCSECGKIFSDEDFETEVTQEETVLPALGHDPVITQSVKPADEADGHITYWICSHDEEHIFYDAEGTKLLAQEDLTTLNGAWNTIMKLNPMAALDEAAAVEAARKLLDEDLTEAQRGMLTAEDLQAMTQALATAEKSVDDNRKAKAVKDQIAALPDEPRETDAEAVTAAQTAYDDLKTNDPDAYAKLSAEDVQDLETRLAAAAKSVADDKTAQDVRRQIEALPEVPTENDEQVVSEARAAYEDLKDNKPDAYAKLNAETRETLEETLAAAEKNVADDKTAQNVRRQIEALPEVPTEADEGTVAAARSAYEDLKENNQDAYKKLSEETTQQLEQTLAAAEKNVADDKAAQNVRRQIEALPAVPVETDAEAVTAAKAAYEDLKTGNPDAYAKLSEETRQKLEQTLAAAEKNVADDKAAQDVRRQVEALPAVPAETDADAVAAARTAYEDLKANNPDAYAKLDAETKQTLENTLAAAEKNVADDKAAQDVRRQVEGLPKVPAETDADTVAAAKAAYEDLKENNPDAYAKLTAEVKETLEAALAAAEKSVEDDKAAQDVRRQIEALPPVPVETDTETVAAARKAYEDLKTDNPDAYAKLDAETRQALENTLAAAEKNVNDDKTAQDVKRQIEALPAVPTEADLETVAAAKAAYEDLKTNNPDAYAKLDAETKQALEGTLAAAEKNAADDKSAQDVKRQIEALPAVPAETDAEAVAAAQAAYDSLKADNPDAYAKLDAATKQALESTLAAAAKSVADDKTAQDVKRQIEALPAVPAETDADTVAAAKAAYEDLKENNPDAYAKLTAEVKETLEAALAAAEKSVEDDKTAQDVRRQIEALPAVPAETDAETVAAARKAYEDLKTDNPDAYAKLDAETKQALENTLAVAEKNVNDDKAAQDVKRQIEALPAVPTEADLETVAAAKAAYEDLKTNNPDAYAKLDAETKQALEGTLAAAEKNATDDKSAQDVKRQIEALPAVPTEADLETVAAAKAAYEDLKTNNPDAYAKLDAETKQALEGTLAAAEKNAADDKSAQDVKRQIEALPAVPAETDAEAVAAAQAAYDSLKAGNPDAYAKLDAAATQALESTLAAAAKSVADDKSAQDVKRQIEALPAVPAETDADTVAAAKAAYEDLKENNPDAYAKLTAEVKETLEAALTAAEKSVEDDKAAQDVKRQVEALPAVPAETDAETVTAAKKAYEDLKTDNPDAYAKLDAETTQALENTLAAAEKNVNDDKAAQDVKRQIEALPAVPAETDAEAVAAAKAAYEDLKENNPDAYAKLDAETSQALEEALAAAEKNVADDKAAQDVKRQIEALPEDPTEADMETVAAAKAAYEDLKTNNPDAYAKLDAETTQTLENTLAAAEKNATDDKAAQDVKRQIEALPAVPAETDAEAVAAAQTAYDSLKADNPDAYAKLDAEATQALESTLAAAQKSVADDKSAQDVKRQIEALPAVPAVSDEDTVAAAEAAYEALTDAQKAKLSDDTKTALEKKLTDARKSVEDDKTAQAVAAQINALADNAGVNDAKAVEDARKAYDALTDAQKAKLSDAAKTALESKLSAAEASVKAAQDKKSAGDAKAKIDEILGGLPAEPGVGDADKVAAAKDVYNALTDDQKAALGTAATSQIEAAFAKADQSIRDDQKAQDVLAQVNALTGNETVKQEKNVTAARAAYNGLTASQKKKLTNAQKTSAEALLTKAEKSVADDKTADKVAAQVNALPDAPGIAGEAAVTAARKAYNALTTGQKAKLTAAEKKALEAKLAKAEKSVADEKAAKAKAEAEAAARVEAQAAFKLNVKAGAKNVPIQLKKKNKKIKAIALVDGDALATAVSSNTKYVTASVSGNKVVLKGLKNKKKATITVTTKKGAVITFSVKVQKKKVKTKKITAKKKYTIKVGETLDLGWLINPITTSDKLTFRTSKKKVASVGKKSGLVTAKKAGTAKITITSGKKKKVIRVKITE